MADTSNTADDLLSYPSLHRTNPLRTRSPYLKHIDLQHQYDPETDIANLYYRFQQSAVYLLLSTTTTLPPCFSRSTLLNNLLHNQHMKHKCRHLQSARTSVHRAKETLSRFHPYTGTLRWPPLVYTSQSHGTEVH